MRKQACAFLMMASVALCSSATATPTVSTSQQITSSKEIAIVEDDSRADARSSSAKDLFLRETVGFKYVIELVRNGQAYLVDSRFPFVSGDQIKFHVQPNTNGFMHVVMKQGSSGKSAVLFPESSLKESGTVSKGYEYVIPSNGTLEFDDTPGAETLQLVFANEQLTDNALLARDRSIIISPKPGATKVGSNCYIDTPAALSTGTNTDKSHMVTMVSTERGRPLAVDLVLSHSAGPNQAMVTPAVHQTATPTATPTTTAPTANRTSTIAPTAPDAVPPKRPGGDAPVNDKWAVVIGISKFKIPGMNLLFASKDANDFAKFLIDEQHFAADHVKVITDAAATKQNVEAELTDEPGFIPRNVQPGDLVVVYIASHAMSDTDDHLERQNYLVVHDTDPTRPYSSGINLQEFTSKVKNRLRTRTDRIAFILDTCHAGAAKSVMLESPNVLANFQGTGKLIIAACRPDQVSFDSPTFKNGLFTHCLIEGLRKNPNMQAAFDSIKQQVESESVKQFKRQQSPILKADEWQGSPLVLSAPPQKPRKPVE